MPRIEIVEGDITAQQVDAVVNAANSTLLGGGGVDGAIHAAAGPALLAECREVRSRKYLDGLPVGEAVATGAGDLPARWVIHTVGPNWHRGQQDSQLLANAFRSSLAEAERVGAHSVAFPAVSAGVYGWDRDVVARIALGVAHDHRGPSVQLIRFVLFGPDAFGAFEQKAERGAADA